jgi:DNA-nicking Smr family endonuclease
MKKKKQDNHLSAEFRNKPFQTLKGLTPLPAAGEKKIRSRCEKTVETVEDGELFLRAVAGARKIRNAITLPDGTVPKIPDEKPDSLVTTKDQELFLQAMRQGGTMARARMRDPDETGDAHRRSSSSRMKQLKRGTIRISQELDLHGFLRDEAMVRLEHFIADAFHRGLEAVLVITGKGVNSPEGPVLQGAASAWLRDRGKGMVVEFSPAPREKGGTGAFVVFLRKKK